MKINTNKSFLENKGELLKTIFYGLIIFFIIGSLFILWKIFKPIPEIVVDKIIEPQTVENSDGKKYIFLVTNDGDYINQNLSKDRYRVLINNIRKNKDKVKWNLLLSGAEIENLKKSNAENKIISDLKNDRAEGFLDIGYSAKNETKYQSDLKYHISDKLNFKEKVSKAKDFLSCGKDFATGICRDFATNEGGPASIKVLFGDISNISELEVNSPFFYDYAAKAMSDISESPTVALSFANEKIKDIASVQKLVQVLSPTKETPSTSFWMNNKIIITDFDIKNNIAKMDTLNSNGNIEEKLSAISQKNSVSISPIYFGGTGLYAKEDPMVFAYANGGSKELAIDKKYRQIEKDNQALLNSSNLEKVIEKVSKDNKYQFVTSKDLLLKISTNDLNNVTKKELDHIARWIIIKWNDNNRIPNYAYDGRNYYSLRESFYLLYKAFSDRKKINEHALPKANIKLKDVYGPFEMPENTINESISRNIVMGTIIDYLRLNKNGYWDTGYSTDAIEGKYLRENKEITAAEMLYAMATIYTTDFSGRPAETIIIPKSKTYPETLELLEKGLGCNFKDDCIATSWSLKPLKIK